MSNYSGIILTKLMPYYSQNYVGLYNRCKPSHNWLQQTVTHIQWYNILPLSSVQMTGSLDKVCLQELTKTSSLDEIQTDCMHFNLETSSHF